MDSLQDVTAVYHACYDLGIFWFESENIPYSRDDFIRYYQITKTLSRGSVALVKCFRVSKVIDIGEKLDIKKTVFWHVVFSCNKLT